ncbi:MAG: tRNA epoxyqueuosine(34) reductase QueG [Kiritimatiellia bacterium]
MMPPETYYPVVADVPVRVFASAGLRLLGIAAADAAPEASERYRQWLAAGRHGDMDWLERHAAAKYTPQAIVPGCRSVLIAGLSYYQPGVCDGVQGRVARYAWGRDYHKVLGNRLRKVARELALLYPEHAFKGYADAVPLDERYYAAAGAAGFLGRNTLLIHSGLGSWFVIGEVLSTYHWSCTTLDGPRHGACPRGCRKCLDVCPTGALTGSGQMDARRCISYLTIEHKGGIPLALRKQMGDWIFGCDLCQEVCPFQLRRQVTQEADFLAWRAGPGLAPAEILQMDADGFAARFAGTPIMRTGLWRMQRNACIVAGNLQDVASVFGLQRIRCGTDSVLREHAAWALSQYDCS